MVNKDQDAVTIEPEIPTKGLSFSDFISGMVPFIGTPISGSTAWIGWGRIGIYSIAGATLYKRNKTVSKIFIAAAALSLATSITTRGHSE